jgi:hypothetical protein
MLLRPCTHSYSFEGRNISRGHVRLGKGGQEQVPGSASGLKVANPPTQLDAASPDAPSVRAAFENAVEKDTRYTRSGNLMLGCPTGRHQL